jgi:cerevisin
LDELFSQNLLSANQIIHEYNLGYAAVLDHKTVERLRVMPGVDMIEVNQLMNATEVQQSPKNWGLDRISQRQLPLSGQYPYPDHAGEGVDVYVVDTGVNIQHEDFEGRAVWGITTPQGDEDHDGNGHGTHVASTIAGKKFGVAKKANIIAVKVLGSSGSGMFYLC